MHIGDTQSTILGLLSGVDGCGSDGRNHCVPVLDVFHDEPDSSLLFMVIPFLRHFQSPALQTVDDVLEFVKQLLEVRHLSLRCMSFCHLTRAD